MSHIRYRPDIDGLRSLAVLPVVAFHTGFSLFSGGFIGVDIFFVISGYLIGRGIVEDLTAGTFSIANFYERRFRRILPALLVMLAITTAVSCVLLFPHFLDDYGKSLAAAVASVSNIYFWQTTNYFAAPAESQPLLHTWSLAVEEQYYLLMPVILMLAFRFARRHLLAVIWVIAIVSFALSVAGVLRYPSGTFYLLHTRAWELMAGLLAYLTPLGVLRHRPVREVVGWSSLAVIAACILSYTGRMPFPGLAALPPVLAAAALIAVGAVGGSSANRLLAWRPLVWIGLISYSLYLWHWPVIVMYKFGLQQSTEALLPKLMLVLVSFGLAWLSWRFVERPFRTLRHWSRARIFGSAAMASAVLLAAGGGIVLARGLPQRYPPHVLQLLATLDYNSDAAFRQGQCFILAGNRGRGWDLPVCLASQPGKPNVLLIGDSQAAHLYYGMARTFMGSNIWQITGADCDPTFDDAEDPRPRCRQMHAQLGEILARTPPDLVVVAGRWDPRELPLLEDWVRQIRATGTRVLISGSVPMFDEPLPAVLAFDAVMNRPNGVAKHMSPGLVAKDRAARAIAGRQGASYVSMADALCDKGRWPCRTMATPGVPMYFDDGHFTEEGSLVAAQFLIGRDPMLKR